MAQRIVLTSATLFDGANDAREGMTVVVEGETITAIGKDIPVQAGELRVDLGGKLLMPGMTQGHFHADYGGLKLADVGKFYLGTQSPPAYLAAIAIQNLGFALQSGITNVIGAGCSSDMDAALKLAVRDGRMMGPRIRACGLHINTTANENEPSAWWIPAPERQDGLQVVGGELFADGVEGMRKAVRHQLRRGVEVMKIFPSGGHGIDFPEDRRSMAREEIEVVIRTAHDRGAIVRGHITTKTAMMESIALGIDIVDHGDFLDEEVIEAMVKHGTFYVPSMLFLKKLLPTDEGDLARASQLEPVRRSFEHLQKTLHLVNEAGVKIVPGDDYGLEFMMHGPGNYAEELQVYVDDCGISAKDVLTWATRNGGLMMGQDNLGQVKEGFVADLVVVNGNPLNDIGLLRDVDNIELIMKDGQIVKNTIAPAAGKSAAGRQEATLVPA